LHFIAKIVKMVKPHRKMGKINPLSEEWDLPDLIKSGD
jgi:hypothetical protein